MGGHWHRTRRRINIFSGKGNDTHELGTVFFFVRESYQQLRGLSLLVIGYYIIRRGRWLHIIVLNGHAPTEDKTDDLKDSFYMKRVIDKFPKYRIKILLDFSASVGREAIFKPKIGNETCTKLVMIM
jgi:hypothetical protein